MTVLLTTTAPVFGVVVAGYVAAHFGAFGERGAKRLVTFVFNVAIPVMLFRSLAGIDFPEEIPWGFLLAFYGGAFVTYGAGMAVARVRFARPLDEQAIYGMGAGFSNTVLLGIPLMLSAFGPGAVLPTFLIIAFHSVTLLPVTVALIQTGRRGRDDAGVRLASLVLDVLANPIIIGILLGLTANYFGLTLPGPVDWVAGLIARVAIPCALLALGASLAGYPLVGELEPALLLASLKLIIHPLITWIIAVPVLGLGAPWAPVAIVMAGMPSGAMVYLFGARYETVADVAARTVLVASALSVVTVSALLVLFGGAG